MKKINKLIYVFDQVFSFICDKDIKFNTYKSIVKNKSYYFEKIKEEIAEVKTKLSSFALPLIRNRFSSLRAYDIVSVQPMKGPVGQIFYMNYEYGMIKISESYLKENYPYLYERTQTLLSKIKEIFKINSYMLDGLKNVS